MLLSNTSVAVQKGTLYWSVYDSDLHECSKFIISGIKILMMTTPTTVLL